MVTLDDIQEASGGKRHENYIHLCCPFHDDVHPSLLAHEDGFKCLSCGEWGNLDKLLAKLKGTTPKPRNLFRTPWRRWLRDRTIQQLAIEAHENLIDFPQQAVYLRRRKIDHLIRRMKIGWMDGFYFFPIFSPEHKIVGLVARTGAIQDEIDMRYITPPDQDPQLFVPNWKRVLQSNYLYVVYGIIDSYVMESLEEPVVTWSIGKNLPAEALAQFRKKIIVVPDEGEQKDGLRLIKDLGWRGNLKKLEYPERCKDPADIYQTHGAEQLLVALG